MFLKFLTALCVCAVISSAAGVNIFRPDYQFDENTTIFYKVHREYLKWSDAVATCKLEQSELALPLSEAQAEVLKTKMTSKTTWVGLHDKYIEGDFYTLNGVPATEIYTNWKAGEPDDEDGHADCVKMDRTGAYSDALCNETMMFICTKEKVKVKPQTACATTDGAYFLWSAGQNCYKLHKEPQSWQNAVKVCEREMASLVANMNTYQTKLLTDNLNTIPKNTLRKNHFNKDIFWLAFSDRLNKRGHYTTFGGEPLPVDVQWVEGMPEGAKEDEKCVALLRNGTITLGNCDSLALFFCEKRASLSNPEIIPS